MKPLIVGESPPPRYQGNVARQQHYRGFEPLHEPLSGKSGQRLAKVCGLSMDEFLRRFDRINIFDRWPGFERGTKFRSGHEKRAYWPKDKAARRAREIARSLERGRIVVTLGRRVHAAFGFGLNDWFSSMEAYESRFFNVPHPSGINLWWNHAVNVGAAQQFFAWLMENTGEDL